MYLWRYKDDVDDEWYYSEIPVNPQKWLFVECFNLFYRYEDGVRDYGELE